MKLLFYVKRYSKKEYKHKKGKNITLIALVITIIFTYKENINK